MKRLIGILAGLLTMLGMASAQDYQTDTVLAIRGDYSTTYYARFEDWEIFSVLLPMTSMDSHLPYHERFDLTSNGQITGQLTGQVESGQYRIELPSEPHGAAWLDTDGDPATQSHVKVFVAGISTGLVGQDYVSRYDFIYTRSLIFDPNTHLWNGHLLVWADDDEASFPILSGADRIFYTSDDTLVTVSEGWSVVEVKGKAATGTESVRVYRVSEAEIPLTEPPQFSNVDLRDLSYEQAFLTLLDELQRTYVFTDFRGVDWEQIRNDFSPQAASVSTPEEFQTLLQDALFSFYDGHLSITGAGLPNELFGRLGMQVYPVNGELMVIETQSNSPIGSLSEIIPGTVILKVNDLEAMTYFENLPRYVFSGGHQIGDDWLRGGMAFRGVEGTVYKLTYRLPDGRISTTALRTAPLNEIWDETEVNRPSEAASYEILPNNIGLVVIRNFISSTIDDVWDEAIAEMVEQNVEGIIIDLRENGGGFSALSNYMLGDLLDEDLFSGREISSLDEDGDGQIEIKDEFYFARHQIFDPAKVVVMIGPNCYSACEFAALAFQDVGATVIGHLPSGGAGGGVGASYLLPAETRVYGMAVVRSEDPNGQVLVEGTGVQLDIQVPFEAQSLASGADLVLDAAQKFLLQ